MIYSDYQEVEYIETTGTQYIDTGISAIDYLEGISYRFRGYPNDLVEKNILFGSAANENFSGIAAIFNGNIQIAIGETPVALSQKIDDTDFLLAVLISNTIKENNYGSINGKELIKYTMPTSVAPSNNIYLLSCNGQEEYGFKGKIYSFTMSTANGTILRDFVPCYRKSDNTIGLYDFINDVFYVNKGTGVFTKGPDVYPIHTEGINFSKVKHITIPEGIVRIIKIGEQILWRAAILKKQMSIETKINSNTFAFVKENSNLQYLDSSTESLLLPKLIINTQDVIHFLANKNKLVSLDSYLGLITKKIALMNIEEKINSISKVKIKASNGIESLGLMDIKAIIKNNFNVDNASNILSLINSKVITKNKFNVDNASNILSLINSKAIIKNNFNADNASNILSLINSKAIIKNNFNISDAANFLVDENINLNNDFNLYADEAIQKSSTVNSYGRSYLFILAGTPIYLENNKQKINFNSSFILLENRNPIHLSLSAKSNINSSILLNTKLPIRLTANSLTNSKGNGIIESKAIAKINAKILILSAEDIQMSTIENSWEYPVQTGTNLKITQAKVIIPNNNNLEVE